ncbi:type II toxin-antitoxin system HicA family toxin [Listeria rocourtiae]
MFFRNPITNRATMVPYHSKTLGKGLGQAILKQAGLK